MMQQKWLFSALQARALSMAFPMMALNMSGSSAWISSWTLPLSGLVLNPCTSWPWRGPRVNLFARAATESTSFWRTWPRGRPRFSLKALLRTLSLFLRRHEPALPAGKSPTDSWRWKPWTKWPTAGFAGDYWPGYSACMLCIRTMERWFSIWNSSIFTRCFIVNFSIISFQGTNFQNLKQTKIFKCQNSN